MNRRDFFKKITLNKAEYIRPPYHKENELFNNCIHCSGKCKEACEENIIEIAPDKTPYIDFQKGGCTFCKKCFDFCDLGVLNFGEKKRIAAYFKIEPKKCLAWVKIVCNSCLDVCNDKAITFNNLFNPSINNQCVGCGFCLVSCPVSAIEYTIQ